MTPRNLDLAESLTNAAVGLVVSWLFTWLVLGFAPGQSVGITLAFFGLSFSRAWVLRAIFRRLGDG